jgi:hypothetical protein
VMKGHDERTTPLRPERLTGHQGFCAMHLKME